MERDFQNLGDVLVVALGLLQTRLDLDGLGQGDRGGGVVGDHLRQAIDLTEGELHDPADIAQHGPRLQAAEGDDLRHPVGAVALTGRRR